MIEPNRPFRWDLVRPDHLGSLLDGIPEPDLWFLDELTDCAAKVLARSENGDLYFLGRSVDSVFDPARRRPAGSGTAAPAAVVHRIDGRPPPPGRSRAAAREPHRARAEPRRARPWVQARRVRRLGVDRPVLRSFVA